MLIHRADYEDQRGKPYFFPAPDGNPNERSGGKGHPLVDQWRPQTSSQIQKYRVPVCSRREDFPWDGKKGERGVNQGETVEVGLPTKVRSTPQRAED